MERNGGDGAESESESDGDADAEASADGDESGQHVPQTPPDIGLNLAITRHCCYLFGPPGFQTPLLDQGRGLDCNGHFAALIESAMLGEGQIEATKVK